MARVKIGLPAFTENKGRPTGISSTACRYHNDASTDPFDDKDKKSYHDASVDGNAKDEKQIIEDVNKVAAVIGMRFEAKPEFVPVNGDGDRALFRLAMQPWAHVKREKMPGAEAGT